ncbi:MAG: hypothetical protein PWP23_2630 [Candidatus Sumerlaeota bacterium]|nr:hypothetical protein [Candidatus Sumerlaeota bacterium]
MRKFMIAAAVLMAGCAATSEGNVMNEAAEAAKSQAAAAAIEAAMVSPEHNRILREAPQGGSVTLEGLGDLDAVPKIPFRKVVLPGPQYMISDDPEYIRIPEAVSMREEVQPGTVRLYVYNVNGVKEPAKIPRKITAVIENLGDQPMNIRMLRRAHPEPSGNYFHIGKTGLLEFFTSEPETGTRTVPVGGAIAIDPEMEARTVLYNDLVHGLYEFLIDQPGRVSVLQTAPEESGPAAAKRIREVLPTKSHSGAGRGLFGVSNYLVLGEEDFVLDTADGPQRLVIADGKDDPWVTGTEHTIDEPAVLKGNYGVMYDIEIERASSDGRGLALVTWNARFGSEWCGGMANTMMVSEGMYPAGAVSIPSDKLVNKSAPEYVVVQVFPPVPEGTTETIRLRYSPPGASCLPTPLAFIPVDFDK